MAKKKADPALTNERLVGACKEVARRYTATGRPGLVADMEYSAEMLEQHHNRTARIIVESLSRMPASILHEFFDLIQQKT